MVLDDPAFLARLRAGDDAAYESLVRDCSGRLLAIARRMLRSEEDARDAVQDAFLQAFRGIDRFAGEARLTTWLSRIVVNVCLMRLRTRRRHPERPIEELLPRFQEDGHRVDPGPPWRPSGPDPAEDREVREHVRACIDELPEPYRTALVLRHIEELDVDDAAALLGIRPEAFKMRVHRARQALRELLDPRFAERAA